MRTYATARRRTATLGLCSEGPALDAGYKAGEIAMPPVIPRVRPLPKRGNRWGVILAGGDGVRLRPLTKLICGDERPKQFCPLFDGRTLLAQTLRRAELTFPREQLMVS